MLTCFKPGITKGFFIEELIFKGIATDGFLDFSF